MMGWLIIFVIMTISLAATLSLAAIIYVIVKRVQDKKEEDFEDRDY
jgi:Na+-transporting NADH:ubiquinone oxidoreductase subunit NqrC